jgi:hypothetical protein
VPGAHDGCAGVSGKGVEPEKRGQSREARQIGKPATKHDRVRIEHIDDRSQTPRQPVLIEVDALDGQRIARRRGLGNRNGHSLLAAAGAVIARHPGTLQEGFDAASLPAITPSSG